jgi:hypothetical protein
MNNNINEDELLEALQILSIKPEVLDEFFPNIVKPLSKPSQLEFNYQEFFYWTEKGIIDIPKPDKGQSPWSRLNLLEVLWIKIVRELRTFNIPFSAIVKLKSTMFCNTLEVMRSDVEFTSNETDSIYNNSIVKNAIESIVNNNDQELEELFNENKVLFYFLTSLFADIMFFNSNVNVIVIKDKGEYSFIVEGYKNQFIDEKNIENAKKRTHLIINLRSLFAEYFLLPELEKLNEDFGIITKEEKEIIVQIRNNQVKEINIKKDENEIITYTATSTFEIKDDQVTAIKRQLRMNEFNEVRLVLRNDKHIYIENKRKVKLRPDKTAQ